MGGWRVPGAHARAPHLLLRLAGSLVSQQRRVEAHGAWGGVGLCKGREGKGVREDKRGREETPPTFLPSQQGCPTTWRQQRGCDSATQRPAHSVTPGVWLVLNVTHSNAANTMADLSPFMLLGIAMHSVTPAAISSMHTVARASCKKKGNGQGEGI